jgi:hypothetical protein
MFLRISHLKCRSSTYKLFDEIFNVKRAITPLKLPEVRTCDIS